MKVLVVYDTVSPTKLTMKVAEDIVYALKNGGMEVDFFQAMNVNRAIVKDYDCLIVGGPKMYFRASKRITEFLNGFQDKEFSGKCAAVFDTEMKSGMGTIGNATKAMEGKLRKIGFEIVSSPLKVYVEGKINQMQLKDGELQKTKNWAQEVAKVLQQRF
jgi:flavodoxin